MSALVKKIILKPLKKFKSYSRKKKIIIIVVLVIVGFLGFQFFGGKSGNGYTTDTVKRSTIIEEVTETGDVVSNGRVDIYSPSTGIVEEVFVRNGEPVTEGQELLTIKSTATEQEVSQALAAYLAAQNSLDSANSTAYALRSLKDTAWKKYFDLSTNDTYENSDGTPRDDKRNSSSEFQSAQGDWLAAESKFKSQQAVISQAQAAVSSTYLLYQATQNATVKATADGTLSNLSISVGSSVKANTLTSLTRPLATIANFGVTEVVVSLSENDIAKVAEGQKTEVELSSVDKKYEGIVRRVDSIGTEENGVVRYNAYIEIIRSDEKVRSGMNADVMITTKTIPDVLSVPNSSVKPYQGGRAVRVPGKNGNVEYVMVEVGIRGKERTEIISGLTEGQIIITTLSNEQLRRPGFFGN